LFFFTLHLMDKRPILWNELVNNLASYLLIDVRSPAEYAKAHIPTAINVPIFTNEQRQVIGTLYKQASKSIAIEQGMKDFKANMLFILQTVNKLQPWGNENPIVVHCARGGMRSAAVCWLLQQAGWKVLQVKDGYKAYRNWCLQQFSTPHIMHIIGGYTGSGKTDILQELFLLHKKTIDLEKLAAHKGSSFGGINMPVQPSQEQFENNLAQAIFDTKGSPFFIEDESNRIGNVMIPLDFWLQMRSTKVLFLEIPFANRLAYLQKEYGILPIEEMEAAINRIAKRLGGLQQQQALTFLQEKNIAACFAILLKYYDKHYALGFEKRENANSLKIEVPCATVNASINASLLLQKIQ
jgi:tRNA 2-selenouridine synthase